MANPTKKLGFGLMRMPLLGDGKTVDLEAVKQMVDVFMQRGFTYFDTAWPYHDGQSENILRQAVVERYDRDRFTITTKCPVWETETTDDMERIFNAQLERLGTDYVDYYWLHALDRGRIEKMDRIGAWDFMVKLRDSGRARHIGFSYHDDAETLERALAAHPEMEIVQLQINYADWDSPSVQSRLCYEAATAHGRPVVVMEPVKGGTLAKVPERALELMRGHSPQASPASWAVRYAASLPNVMMALSGMSDMEQLMDNTSYMQEFKPLDDAERDIIRRVADIYNDNTAIKCTACRYCTAGCPMEIAIPDFFALYNTDKRYEQHSHWLNEKAYKALLEAGHGAASQCIQCGQCESQCPQHLPIIDSLQLVAQAFE